MFVVTHDILMSYNNALILLCPSALIVEYLIIGDQTNRREKLELEITYLDPLCDLLCSAEFFNFFL